MAVVGDHDQRPIELRQGQHQGLTGFQIQVIGRFVQQQQIGFFPHDEGQGQPCLFAARERRDRRGGHVTAEIEAAEETAEFLLACAWRPPHQVLERRVVRLQGFKLVLGEISNLQTLGSLQPSGERRQGAGQGLDEGRFTLTVGAEQADALARLDRQRDGAQDRAGRIGGGIPAVHGLQGQHRIGDGISRAKGKAEFAGGLDSAQLLQLLQCLDAALGLLGLACLGLEAGDEALQMSDMLLLLVEGRLLQGEPLGTQALEGGVVAAVAGELAVLDMQDGRADRIQEFAVVRNGQQGARVARQPVFQPDDGI